MLKIKVLVSGILLVLFGITSNCQENKFNIGLEIGPSAIFMHGNDLIDEDHKATFGFSGGFTFQYNFKKIISIRTNLSYERKGSLIKFNATDNNGENLGEVVIDNKFEYLTLPLHIRATFGKRKQFFANTGPYFGYLLKQSYESKGDNFPAFTGEDTHLYQRLDIGISSGLGFYLPIDTKLSFSIEVRSNFGLYNISKGPVFNNGEILTYSSNFLFGLSYKLGERNSD